LERNLKFLIALDIEGLINPKEDQGRLFKVAWRFWLFPGIGLPQEGEPGLQ